MARADRPTFRASIVRGNNDIKSTHHWLLSGIVAILLIFSCPLATAQSSESETVSLDYKRVNASASWSLLPSPPWIARNAHATTVFKGYIWLAGGRVDSYMTYDLRYSVRQGDLWYYLSTALTAVAGWDRPIMSGDFYAQMADAVQPGSDIAPWYARFGHSLDAVSSLNDGNNDFMLLAGGFAPKPMNDLWLTPDGSVWSYCGTAPWSPRAFHATATFENRLYLAGGTPLVNDVWILGKITRINRRPPLTRATYLNYTYHLDWTQVTPSAQWSPRCGMSMISQYYFQPNTTDTPIPRLLLVGGFGGWPNGSQYDGFQGRADVWESYDGVNWTALTTNAAFGPRAWFGLVRMVAIASDGHTPDPRYDISNPRAPPRLFLVGGNIGFSSTAKTQLVTIDGKSDAWWSRDGITWQQTNYQEGGGTGGLGVPFYSSQEWVAATVDSKKIWLGQWGHTLITYNEKSGLREPGDIFLIGGDKAAPGVFTNNVFRSLSRTGLFCDKLGDTCGYSTGLPGICRSGYQGCICPLPGTGEYCDNLTTTQLAGIADGSIGYGPNWGDGPQFSRRRRLSAANPRRKRVSVLGWLYNAIWGDK